MRAPASGRADGYCRLAGCWKRLGLGVMVLLGLTLLGLTPGPAHAAGYALDIVDNFSCPDDPSAPAPQIVRTLPNAATNSGVFKFVMDAYQTALFTVMAQGYCAVRSVVAGPLLAGMLLAVILFGIAVLAGLSKFSVREAMILVFKLSLVVMFALNAQIAMSVVFKFFYYFSNDAVGWVANIDPSPGRATGFEDKDSDFGRFAAYFGTNPANGKPFNPCAGPLLLFLLAFSIIFPVIGAPLMVMIVSFIMIFVRAVLGFLVAMGAICMLMAAAPLFIAFALFRTTYGFFDRWLKSMISYSLQMVLVFFIFWAAIGLFDFYDMFTNLEKTLALPSNPEGQISFLLSNTNVPLICTPCEGFKYTGGVGWDRFTCSDGHNGVIPAGTHAAQGVPIMDNLTKTVPTFGSYLVTNLIYLIVLLWAIKEIIVAAPLIAYQLAGDPSSMSLGGRVGRSAGAPGAEERYQFDFGGTSNSLDRRMDKMTEYMRFSMDEGYMRSMKDDIRKDSNPEFMKGNMLSRLSQGMQMGLALSDSELSPQQIYEQLPLHMKKEDDLYKARQRLAEITDQTKNARTHVESIRRRYAQEGGRDEELERSKAEVKQLLKDIQDLKKIEQEFDANGKPLPVVGEDGKRLTAEDIKQREEKRKETLAKNPNAVAEIEGRLQTARKKLDQYRLQHGGKEISDEMMQAAEEEYIQFEREMEIERAEVEKARTEYMESYNVMDVQGND